MNVTWAGIAAIGVLFFTGYTGYRRGFIKEIVSFFFVFLALALAWMLNPYVNTFLMQKTSLYDKIQESCRELPGGQNVVEGDEGDEETEGSLISQLPLPEILQKNLTVNNTEEAYQYLAVDTFGDYISEYLARAIINGLSYLIAYALANLVLRVVLLVLDMIAGLPLISDANRLTGGIVGVAKGILFIWIALLLLTILCSSDIGKRGLELVEKDSVLQVLYKHDVLVNFFMDIFYKN